ncbi:MAG: FAD-dependent oxidoreductase [Dehalococcoidales bacterium]|nr:FAD-dependent oxidoreductase [Dehalococcoidales bacterium]
MNRNPIKLETGAKVAIIGGGPAGCFFALYLLYYAAEKGVHPKITIYEPRNFNELGPKGCKGCAGILSMSLIRNLSELGLTIPDEIIQSKIEHYAVHSPYTLITISNPEKEAQIASIYRGGGPLKSHYKNPISFDAWLFKQTQERGVGVENRRVTGIYLEQGVSVEVAGRRSEYDLIVLASGVNTKSIPIHGLGYVSPRTRIMAQDELYAGISQVDSRLGNMAHAFLIPHAGLIFGTLVPKGPFINVSVMSGGKYPVSITDFLNQDIVRKVLPEHYERTCGCYPRAVISSAQNYYADRCVAVGDAAVSRLYKDGTGSSLLTAREAARTVVWQGISRYDFERHYQPFCDRIYRDNRWGHLLFSINNKAKDSSVFLSAQRRLIGEEQHDVVGPQPFTKAAWGMFTGSYSYTGIARMVISPVTLVRLLAVLFRESSAGLLRKRNIGHVRLHVGSRKVLILGSGFGGTYVLRYLVPALNRNENIETTMVSDENFFFFSPLLHEVAMGNIEPRHVAYPIRRLHWRDRFNFVQASVKKIDLDHHKVITTMGTMDFDYLILALGSVTNMSGIDSMEGNVFTLKTLYDSVLIRNHVIGAFEQASIENDPERQRQLLTFVISGAGYTGVQVVTELRDFIFRSLIKFHRKVDPDNIQIILVEAESKIMADLHTKLGAYAMQQLQQMGIEVKLKARITHVSRDRVEINSTENVPTNTLIWVAGVVANPRIADLDVAKDSIGRVSVNEYLEIPDVPGVYAIGDCAHFKDLMSGRPIPPRAHTAVRQAKVAALNILAEIRGKHKRPYRYVDTGEVVSLGVSKAVFRFHGLRLYGLPAKLIWLLAYSLLVTGTYNRIRILMDWLLSFVFGRDITFLKIVREIK